MYRRVAIQYLPHFRLFNIDVILKYIFFSFYTTSKNIRYKKYITEDMYETLAVTFLYISSLKS